MIQNKMIFLQLSFHNNTYSTIPVQVTKAYVREVVEIHSFWALALDKASGELHNLADVTPGKKYSMPIQEENFGPRSWFGK